MSADFVDIVLERWQEELPEGDFEPLGVISRITRYLRLASRHTNANLEKFGLQETQFNMLCALRRAGAPYQLSPKELLTSMLITSGAITYVIDQMQDAGYVTREPDPRDRRALLVRLTDAGKERVEEAMLAHLRVCDELLGPLDDAQRRGLRDALRLLLAAIEDGAVPASSALERREARR